MGKVIVLGTGPSLKEHVPDGSYTIGVNDIWRYRRTNAVVCLNNPSQFAPERLRIIRDCQPEIFYSQIVNWDFKKGFQLLTLRSGYPTTRCSLEGAFEKSYCSPFVAVQIAYRFNGATEIELYGIDMVNHPNLKNKILDEIKKHFALLKKALQEHGCKMVVHGSGVLT